MMRFFHLALVFTLVFQLTTLNVSLVYPELTLGETTQREVKQPKFLQTKLIPAVLSARLIEQYDSLLFTGDILMARNVEFLMNTKGSEYPFKGLDIKQFSPNPAVVANFEAAIPEVHQPTPTGQIRFSVPTSTLPILKNAGYTHFSLANNHSFDFDEPGYLHTIENLESNFQVFGEPNELFSESIALIDVQDKRVALIGINALNQISNESLIRTFTYAKSKSDLQIVYVHWGEEYALRQNNSQRELAKVFIQNGADIIVGHHPHVVQGIEMIDGVPVFYSLGNYIFDQYFSKDVQEGILLSLTIDDVLTISILPVTSAYSLSQPRLMSTENHSMFLETLAKKSSPELRESISSGYITIGGTVATSTKIAMITDIF